MINPKLLNGKLEIESEDIMGIFTVKSKGKNTNKNISTKSKLISPSFNLGMKGVNMAK